MNRTNIVVLIGTGILAIGTFLVLQADRLATRWQALGNGAWGGTTDPALRQVYHEFGLVALGFGVVLLAIAAWSWLTAGRQVTGHPSVEG